MNCKTCDTKLIIKATTWIPLLAGWFREYWCEKCQKLYSIQIHLEELNK